MEYDVVLCVSSVHKNTALKAIRSLHLFLQPRRACVITATRNFAFFEQGLDAGYPISLIDEDQLIENFTLETVQDILLQRISSPERAGWYFQQFLKMAVCHNLDMADHYLIWDSDTILLRPVEFFDHNGTVLIDPKTEHHEPYFQLIKKLLGIDKRVDHSFIAEHFMINTSYMRELVCELMNQASEGRSWIESILGAIENQELGGSGFSEYETYGNFIAHRHRNSFSCRPLRSTRDGTKLYGANPGRYDILRLMNQGYAFASIEVWQARKKTSLIRAPQFLARKSFSRCRGMFWLADRHSESLAVATKICS